MKRTSWKTALFCGLAISVSTLGLFDRGAAADSKDRDKSGGKSQASDGGRKGGDKPQASGGGNRSGDKPQSSGGGKSQPNQAVRAPPSRGANVPHSSGRGGIHAPAVAAPRQPAQQAGQQQPSINRTPSFSRPNIAKQPAVSTTPPVTVRPAADARIGIDSGVSRPGDGQSGAFRRGDEGLRGNVGAQTRRSDSNQSRIVNRPFVGNTVNFNNRDFNVGSRSYQPAYYRHSGYHGYWNGNRGYGSGSGYRYGSRPGVSVNIAGFGLNLGSSRGYGYGSNYGYGSGYGWGLGNGYGYGGYGYRPLGWGLGGWGLGSLYYNSGYLGYSNPYYIDSYGSYGNYNYAQPIPVSYNSSVVIVDNDPNSAGEVLNNAVAAFRQNDYDAALDITNKGIGQYPDDSVLHEFRSLVLFARQDYQQSASTIHAVLAVGPGWDWTTLSSMYSSVAIYTEQLRALEAFTKANPQDAASRFLLAYHYMSCGHPDSAARHLQQVVKLMPNDRVAADVLKMVAAPQPSETAQQPPQEPTRPAAQPVDPATLVGAWKAARPDGSKFDLTLTNDAKFTWSFAQKGQAAQTFGGNYSVEGNVLALERKDGGSLIAEVTPGGEAKFNFKLLGAPEDDPGLDFSK